MKGNHSDVVTLGSKLAPRPVPVTTPEHRGTLRPRFTCLAEIWLKPHAFIKSQALPHRPLNHRSGIVKKFRQLGVSEVFMSPAKYGRVLGADPESSALRRD